MNIIVLLFVVSLGKFWRNIELDVGSIHYSTQPQNDELGHC